MKNIKFRIWNKNLKRFKIISQKEVGNRCVHLCMLTQQDQFCAFILDSNENRTISLFTGLKDKNNKEIYENDILKFNWKSCELGEAEEYIGEVFWDEKIAGFLIDKSGQWNIMEINSPEVVGNVFENEEMIK